MGSLGAPSGLLCFVHRSCRTRRRTECVLVDSLRVVANGDYELLANSAILSVFHGTRIYISSALRLLYKYSIMNKIVYITQRDGLLCTSRELYGGLHQECRLTKSKQDFRPLAAFFDVRFLASPLIDNSTNSILSRKSD